MKSADLPAVADEQLHGLGAPDDAVSGRSQEVDGASGSDTTGYDRGGDVKRAGARPAWEGVDHQGPEVSGLRGWRPADQRYVVDQLDTAAPAQAVGGQLHEARRVRR